MPKTSDIATSIAQSCYHCGESCAGVDIRQDDKSFCCEGCKTVYNILQENDMCNYYDLNEASGISFKRKAQEKYEYLEDPEVSDRLLDFTNGQIAKVHFYLPQIHCSSCLWLLENLPRLEGGILQSRVNFLEKSVHIQFDPSQTTVRGVVELLASIGYAPVLNLDKLESSDRSVVDKSLYYKLGLAGFAFGNIMLLSFPEYLGLDASVDGAFVRFFGYLNLILILPVITYSGQDYLRSAWQGLRQRHLNIDVPVSLGMLALFGRSAYEILSHSGAGYLDSLAGFVFFLLVGKWFQQKTYYKISFDRDYKSYFPMAANLLRDGKEKSTTIDHLKRGDTIVVRHGELIPADSILLKGEGQIDYSFVTGESDPIHKREGEKLFAGGRQMGGIIELSVLEKVAQSYLTSLWNEDAFTKDTRQGDASVLADKVATYFTWIILVIGAATLIYWIPTDPGLAFSAFTAVLIVACPCAVALSIPFTFGNVLRLLGSQHFYLKNTQVIETLSRIKHIVFDKTGTITQTGEQAIEYHGEDLSAPIWGMVRSLAHQSSHPMSRQIEQQLHSYPLIAVEEFENLTGAGIRAIIRGHHISIGSDKMFETGTDRHMVKELPRGSYIIVDGQVKGVFALQNRYRRGLHSVIRQLQSFAHLSLLTGDHAGEASRLVDIFGNENHLRFNQSPKDKLNYIQTLQEENHAVMMIGDGLNDSGALKQSDIGIVLTEHINNFIPACDAVLDARHFEMLPKYIAYARRSLKLVYAAYGIALIYNMIGLTYAVQGLLSPVIAAILMPLSSITIVLFGMGASTILARKMGIIQRKPVEAQEPTETAVSY